MLGRENIFGKLDVEDYIEYLPKQNRITQGRDMFVKTKTIVQLSTYIAKFRLYIPVKLGLK